ncbi:MAG: rod shape-determining protein MreC [Sulfurovaceae bacterium]|nr:rod shape-determining protein MreC [Sulfurovaceae bacterium]
MNKKIIFFIFILLTALLLLKKEAEIQNQFSKMVLPLKEWYVNLSIGINEYIEKYSSQSKTIDILKEENLLLRKYLYKQKSTINQLQQYSKVKFETLSQNEDVIPVQTISYTKFNDFSTVHLNHGENLKDEKIYGLIQKNVAAGIAIKENGLLEGILLSNPKCQFSTFIGEKKMPGIAKGIDENTMEINFIPKWSKINIGDKVITSGLDNIFLANIPVGTVKNIVTRSTYKTAIIDIYADVLHPNYFYLVKKVPIQIYDINESKKLVDQNVSNPLSRKKREH